MDIQSTHACRHTNMSQDRHKHPCAPNHAQTHKLAQDTNARSQVKRDEAICTCECTYARGAEGEGSREWLEGGDTEISSDNMLTLGS